MIAIGDLEPNEVAELELKIRLMAMDLNYKIIFDYRLSKNKISITDAYYWVSTHFDTVDTKLKLIKSAYLVNKDDWEFYSFFETTSNNHGMQIKVFQEEDTLLNWLEN
ncbi:MAG: hypothetical protein WCJ61_14130 [Paludibacter sp.]